jgi:transposase
MARMTRFVGMDVHAETIAVAIAEGREVRSLGTIPNRADAVSKLIKKLGNPASLRLCYEAAPTGYVLYWQPTRLGVHCDGIAPSLVPKMAGDRIKTDRRDAEKLAPTAAATSARSGSLTV